MSLSYYSHDNDNAQSIILSGFLIDEPNEPKMIIEEQWHNFTHAMETDLEVLENLAFFPALLLFTLCP